MDCGLLKQWKKHGKTILEGTFAEAKRMHEACCKDSSVASVAEA